jgi:hypothetical protein
VFLIAEIPQSGGGAPSHLKLLKAAKAREGIDGDSPAPTVRNQSGWDALASGQGVSGVKSRKSGQELLSVP